MKFKFYYLTKKYYLIKFFFVVKCSQINFTFYNTLSSVCELFSYVVVIKKEINNFLIIIQFDK